MTESEQSANAAAVSGKRLYRPAHLIDILGVQPVLQDTRAKEQPAFGDAVRKNIEHAADETRFGANADAEQDKRKLADCGILR